MPVYKAWDVKRETRKAVAAGTFEEFAKAGELFCCLISEIQSDMYNKCLQRGLGYGTTIFSLTDFSKFTIHAIQTSVYGRTRGEGGGTFSNKNWERGYNFYLTIFFWGGSVLKHYTFFKTTAAPPGT